LAIRSVDNDKMVDFALARAQELYPKRDTTFYSVVSQEVALILGFNGNIYNVDELLAEAVKRRERFDLTNGKDLELLGNGEVRGRCIKPNLDASKYGDDDFFI